MFMLGYTWACVHCSVFGGHLVSACVCTPVCTCADTCACRDVHVHIHVCWGVQLCLSMCEYICMCLLCMLTYVHVCAQGPLYEHLCVCTEVWGCA